MKEQKIIEDGIEYFVKINTMNVTTWQVNGKFHRVSGPAVIAPSVSEGGWYQGMVFDDFDTAVGYHAGDRFWFYQGVKAPVTSQIQFERWLQLKAFL